MDIDPKTKFAFTKHDPIGVCGQMYVTPLLFRTTLAPSCGRVLPPRTFESYCLFATFVCDIGAAAAGNDLLARFDIIGFGRTCLRFHPLIFLRPTLLRGALRPRVPTR